jgi:hypothetical protein
MRVGVGLELGFAARRESPAAATESSSLDIPARIATLRTLNARGELSIQRNATGKGGPIRIKACLALLAVLVLALTSCQKSGPPQVGDAAPDFGLPDSAGTTHHLSDFRGQVVALLGWTNS